MSNLKVCRICLCKDAKVYTYDRYHLKQYYEEIMAKKVYEEDGLSNYFCYECAAILYKFHKFKEKCWTGEKVLQELLRSSSITLSSISQIDRQDKNLKSTIDIISGRERVRTYIVEHKTLSKNLLNEAKTVEISEEECNIDYNSDNSLDDQNLAEIKNEMNNEEAVDDKNVAKKNNEMTDYSIEEDEKSNMDIEINPEEKTTLDLEDERMFTDGEDSHSDSLLSAEHSATKEEINNGTSFEQKDIINSDNEIVLNKNHKKQKRKKTGKAKIDLADNKAKKFKVNTTKRHFLDPTHWLTINLTEEEALEEFRARARDRKYVSAAYHCTDCFKGFSEEDMLNRHIKITHVESVGPVVCRFCKMRFKLKGYLTQHIAQHYTKYKCLRCDLMCPLRSTALYHNDYHGVVRKCKHCEEGFRHQSTYYTHLRTHHRSEYVCTLCGASFVSNNGLNKHKRAMHINAVVNPEEKKVNTYCERCDVKFETWTAYEEHVLYSAKHTEGVEFSEDLINILQNDLAPYLRKRLRSSGLTNRLKILCTLSFLANGSHQKIIGKNVDTYISQPSASRAIHEVVEALNNKTIINKYIRFPRNHNDRQVLKSKFYEKFKIPGVLGCVDGTLVSMIRPKQHEERYYCGKGYHARNVLIINDADLNILHADVTFGGATHDSFVFSNTQVKELLIKLNNNGETVYLLGDSGYPQRPYLMTPISNPEAGTPESHYNDLHSSAWNSVERTIGILKGRFRCLLVHRVLHYDPTMVGKIIIACCVLHNMCNRAGLPAPKLDQCDLDEESRLLRTLTQQAAPQDDLVSGQISRRDLVNQLWRARHV